MMPPLTNSVEYLNTLAQDVLDMAQDATTHESRNRIRLIARKLKRMAMYLEAIDLFRDGGLTEEQFLSETN